MTWKYLNPGDYRLFTTMRGINYTDEFGYIAPVTHKAFGDTSYERRIKPPVALSELWFTFTAFCSWNNVSMHFLKNGISTIYITVASNYIEASDSRSSSKLYSKTFYNAPRLWRVWGHIRTGTDDPFIEVYFNNELLLSQSITTSSKNYSIEELYWRINSGCTLSDIIVSDAPIDLNEHCAFLPIKQTSINGWQFNTVTNKYTTDSTGKTIWQTVDKAELASVLGEGNPTITAVVPQAYDVSTDTTLVINGFGTQLRQGSTVVEHSEDSINSALFTASAITVNPFTNAPWTLDDFDNVDFGITTAKIADNADD